MSFNQLGFNTMKLRYSTASPFARKAVIVAAERGIPLELIITNAFDPATDLIKDNPLSKIPALLLDDGGTLYDSPVIAEYLDSLNGPVLFPVQGQTRWDQLKLQALADGIMDAAVQIRIETTLRPAQYLWPDWQTRQTAAITRALDHLEQQVDQWGDTFLIGQISLIAALDYMDFRATCDWRQDCPRLVAWVERQHRRPSVAESLPK